MTKSKQSFVKVAGIVLKGLPVVAGLVGLSFVIAWISGAFIEKIEPGETKVTARHLNDRPTGLVNEVEKEYIEEAVGTLKAANRSEISSKVLATIQEIHVKAGDYVTKDDLLIVLNTQELNARLSQAKEKLAAATAAATEAENDFNRSRTLMKTNSISLQQYEISERKFNVAKADERRAEQAVKEAEILFSYSKITAPKDGRIVDRLAEPGDTAQPGRPILTLYDVTSLRLETPVIESLAVTLQIGQQLNVRVDSINRDFTATIEEIVPQADAASRSFLVKASLPRSDNLYEGMYGRLQIPAGVRKHLCLDTSAIKRIGQLEFVDVVLDDGALQRRLIKTGQLGMPGHIEVLSGVNAKDKVVLYKDNTTAGGNQ